MLFQIGDGGKLFIADYTRMLFLQMFRSVVDNQAPGGSEFFIAYCTSKDKMVILPKEKSRQTAHTTDILTDLLNIKQAKQEQELGRNKIGRKDRRQ